LKQNELPFFSHVCKPTAIDEFDVRYPEHAQKELKVTILVTWHDEQSSVSRQFLL
jgi:hypothetical protein